MADLTAKSILETEIPNLLKSKPELAKEINAVIHFNITGDTGGMWTMDLTKPATIYHVVLYAGRGRVLDAPHTGAFVGTRSLWTSGLLPVVVRPVAQLALPLVPGASGWSVAQLQQALNRHGARLSVDGGFGPATAAAVRSWKAAHDLAATARVGVRAWLTLGTTPAALPKG